MNSRSADEDRDVAALASHVDRPLRHQALCFALGMAIFLPIGLVVVSRAQSAVESLFGARQAHPPAVAGSKFSPEPLETQPKRRFLAVDSQRALRLYPLRDDGSIGSKPAEVLDLSSFSQGCQLVVHPRLNVLYECGLDDTMTAVRVQGFSIQESGKLSRLGEPISLDLAGVVFRGNGLGVNVWVEPSGNYLYLTQGSRGGATGQRPEIPFYRLNAHGAISSKALSVKLPLPANEFFSVCLQPGRKGSDDMYGFIASCSSGSSGSSAFHFEVQKDGRLEVDSQLQLSGGGIFRTQTSNGFLRDTTWGLWEGLQLDSEGGVSGAYAWPRPKSGEALYELAAGQALGISHSKDTTEARLFDLDPQSDRPVASSLPVSMPRLYCEPGKTITDARAHQVLFFNENEGCLEVTRVGLQSGGLRAWKPQVLDGSGSVNGKVQVVYVY